MLVIDAALKERWDTRAFHIFQAKGYALKGTTSPPVDIQGNKFYFLKAGKGEASQYTVGDEVQPANTSLDRIEIQAEEWDYGDRIYDYNRTRISIREQDVYHENAGMALGRRADKIIYNKLQALALPAGQVIGAFANPFDPALALQGCDAMQAADVPWDGMVFCGLPSRAWNQMLTYKVFSSADYQGPDLPFTKVTDRRSWNGVHWFLLPKHLWKLTGTDLSFYMWHQSCIGTGHNEGPGVRSEWEREVKKKAWWYQNTIDGASVILQTEGIVEFRMKSDSAITLTGL